MASLFTLPDQTPLSQAGTLLAGATLTFTAAGTNTPQNVYQDSALTTPHANPVTADAYGAFAPIYLDPSLPDYKAVLKSSAGVTLKTWDNVPSNQNTSQQFRLKSTAPELIFEETDASDDNGKWRIRVDGEQLLIDIGNDAESSWVNVAALTRIGTFPNVFNFAGQYLKVDGDFVATQTSGSVTVGLTGMSGTVTGTLKWYRTGTKVGLLIPSSISGTSNSTSMTLTGLPSVLLMTSDKPYIPCMVRDNGVSQLGFAQIQRSLGDTSSIVFSLGTTVGAAFTASGSKGLPAGTYIEYDSDGVDIS